MTENDARHEEKYGPIEEYAGGDIKSRHGIVNKWLLLVYAVLFIWALYYLMGPFEGFTPTFGYWGGLGPGLGLEGTERFGNTGIWAFGIILVGVIAFFVWVAILTLRK